MNDALGRRSGLFYDVFASQGRHGVDVRLGQAAAAFDLDGYLVTARFVTGSHAYATRLVEGIDHFDGRPFGERRRQIGDPTISQERTGHWIRCVALDDLDVDALLTVSAGGKCFMQKNLDAPTSMGGFAAMRVLGGQSDDQAKAGSRGDFRLMRWLGGGQRDIDRALDLVERHRGSIHTLADTLMREGTLDRFAIRRIVDRSSTWQQRDTIARAARRT